MFILGCKTSILTSHRGSQRGRGGGVEEGVRLVTPPSRGLKHTCLTPRGQPTWSPSLRRILGIRAAAAKEAGSHPLPPQSPPCLCTPPPQLFSTLLLRRPVPLPVPLPHPDPSR